ncbi:MAG: hypothetical protein H7839_10160 [Magnetococcus sp. YQC-5]
MNSVWPEPGINLQGGLVKRFKWDGRQDAIQFAIPFVPTLELTGRFHMGKTCFFQYSCSL